MGETEIDAKGIEEAEAHLSQHLSGICASYTPIPRVSASDLSPGDFHQRYFVTAAPVVLTGATEGWPARDWTLAGLVERVGDNEVFVRGGTHRDDYRRGDKYTIRRDTFRGYCADLSAANARARSSYLAVASMAQAFPQLLPDVTLPEYLTSAQGGKLHLGPYLWVALKGHYEFCHFDPDDNFLVMVRGSKRVLLFGHDLDGMYPNRLGSLGKTVQSQVDCDSPDLDKFPRFSNARCQHTVLRPGEMLFIPAFVWHQVSALETGISLNMFYGDGGESSYLDKICRLPYREHFLYWLRNIFEQNRGYDNFPKLLSRLDEVLYNFFLKQWHEVASQEQLKYVGDIVRGWYKPEIGRIEEETGDQATSKFPPMLKIRGLLHRDNTKVRTAEENEKKVQTAK